MNDASAPPLALEKAVADRSYRILQLLFALFLAEFAVVWVRVWLPHAPFAGAGWPEGLLLILGAATLLASVARHLPLQNVLLAAAIIAILGGGATVLGAMAGMTIGPIVHLGSAGPNVLLGSVWAGPLVWIIFVLSSRGVVRLVLKRWRETPNYGFWVLGLTAGLTAWLNFGLQLFVTHAGPGNPNRNSFEWQGALLVNFAVCALAALMIAAFATPSLISKKPVTPPAPGYHPVFVWLSLNLLFATGWVVNSTPPAG